jgi:DedD protein
MSKAIQSTSPEYELKHRVTGAAILVALAVLIIPLFLSEPNLEANNSNTTGSGSNFDKTFKSRIVPLNISNVNDSDSETGQLPVTTLDESKPALLDLTGQTPTPKAVLEVIPEPKAGSEEQTKTALVMTQNPESEQKVSKIEPVEIKNTAVEKPAEDESKSNTKDNESKIANLEQQDNQAEDGWIVRVGTFSKKANVESVSSLLSNSGFKPKTTGVTTSLGESTRVWLGPYANRKTADKISDRLKDLIGEKGYVTRTSS